MANNNIQITITHDGIEVQRKIGQGDPNGMILMLPAQTSCEVGGVGAGLACAVIPAKDLADLVRALPMLVGDGRGEL